MKVKDLVMDYNDCGKTVGKCVTFMLLFLLEFRFYGCCIPTPTLAETLGARASVHRSARLTSVFHPWLNPLAHI